MTTRKSSPARNKSKDPVTPSRAVYHHVHSLLQTVRQIAQYEDALCELTHELKREGAMSRELRRELAAVLDNMPSHVFLSYLEGSRAALAGAKHESVKVKRVAKKVQGRKGTKGVVAPAG